MKAAWIFYFQFIFHEIYIIKMYCIIHGSVISHMCSMSVWWVMRAMQFNCKLLNSFHVQCSSYSYIMKMSTVVVVLSEKSISANGYWM